MKDYQEVERIVDEIARDIEIRLVHKLQIETSSTKDQTQEYRKGLRDMRYLVMEFTRGLASISIREALTTYGNQIIPNTLKEAAGELERIKTTNKAKPYDGNDLESACDAYDCAFTNWGEVIRYEDGYNSAITDAQQRLIGEEHLPDRPINSERE